MSDLAKFLRARLDEDEQAAQAAAKRGADWRGLPWRNGDHRARVDAEPKTQVARIPAIVNAGDEEAISDHIARHDPARVRREVEAKRRIIDEHRVTWDTVTADGTPSNEPGCETCYRDGGEVIAFGYCRTLRLLALPYADHPDYREEWRP